MINRDNLSVETDIYCCTISISKNQFPFAEEAMRQLEQEMPGVKFDVPSKWGYHNGGYYYKEVAIGHKYPGRAFEAMNSLEEIIRKIPLREEK